MTVILSCRLCKKNFISFGSRTCTECYARLDRLYPIVREYLRDNHGKDFDAQMVADTLKIDILDIKGLIDLGYLDRDIKFPVDPETLKRQRLAKEIQDSLKQMENTSSNTTSRNTAASYGQQFGNKWKRKS